MAPPRHHVCVANLRRNITQRAFTIFNRNAPRLIGLYPLQLLGIAMSILCRPDEKDLEKSAADTWREPPGYLGEAVRRAKLIPSRANKTEPGTTRARS